MFLAVTQHARDRMKERFGVDLSNSEWTEAIQAIHEKTALRTRIMPDKSEVWRVPVGAATFQMVCSPISGTIITVLATPTTFRNRYKDHQASDRPVYLKGTRRTRNF